MRSRRSSKRFRRAKREYIWITTLTEGPGLTQTPNTALVWPYDILPLVLPADWERGQQTGLQKGCTLLRIVGSLTVFSDSNGGGLGALRGVNQRFNSMIVLKRDKDDTSVLDALAGALDEDILHQEMRRIDWFFDNTATQSWATGTPHAFFPIDIRAKRRLTSQDQIELGVASVRENLDTDCNMSLQVRALLMLP